VVYAGDVNPKRFLPFLAIVMATGLTGCDDDDFSYFFTSDPGFFCFSFGDTVSATSRGSAGTSASQLAGPTPAADAQAAPESVSDSTTGSVQRASYTFDLFSYPISSDPVTAAPSTKTSPLANEASEQ
jgi:hypothetical protein